MQEPSVSPRTPRSDRAVMAFAVLLHLVAPSALLTWLSLSILVSGGGEALLTTASGVLRGFGIVAVISAGLAVLGGALFSLLAPGGLVERSR